MRLLPFARKRTDFSVLWRSRRDSNTRPLSPQPSALSTELREQIRGGDFTPSQIIYQPYNLKYLSPIELRFVPFVVFVIIRDSTAKSHQVSFPPERKSLISSFFSGVIRDRHRLAKRLRINRKNYPKRIHIQIPGTADLILKKLAYIISII